MNIFATFITGPLGAILGFIYSFTNSYGFSIILFTIFIKLILLPLAIKQQKSMAQMQIVQPLISEIQKKYSNDKEKLNQETMKLYQKHKVNPAAGCLPMLVQLPIIFGLYRVIYQPLTYILSMTGEQIEKLATDLGIHARNEITIAEKMQSINLDFLGLNLAQTPQFNAPSVIWIIPILAALTTYLSSKITSEFSKQSSSSNKDNGKGAEMQNSMMKVFPLMTGFISFSLPAGVALYWIVSNVVQIIQQIFLNKYFAVGKKEGNE